MIAVIFEVWPKASKKQNYLEIAADLRPHLEQIKGFISVERFQSLSDSKKILSLSFFEDEAAVARWRVFETHREAQSKARSEVFDDYHLRIAHVIRDYGMTERTQAPDDSKKVHS